MDYLWIILTTQHSHNFLIVRKEKISHNDRYPMNLKLMRFGVY
jgi:hypothetical protein